MKKIIFFLLFLLFGSFLYNSFSQVSSSSKNRHSIVGGEDNIISGLKQFLSAANFNLITNGLVFYSRMDALPPTDVIGNVTITDSSAGQLGVLPDNQGLIFRAINAGANTSHLMLTVPDSPTFNFKNSFTASIWVNNNGSSWDGYRAFLDKSDIFASGNNGWVLYYQTDAGTFKLIVGNSSSLFEVVTPLTSPDGSVWYNITARVNTTNKQAIIGVNGTSYLGTNTYTGTLATNNSPLNIFNPVGAGGNGFGGKMDEIGIWNRVLSDTEVQQIYLAGISNHVGYPFDQQVNNVFCPFSARGLNEVTLQSLFQSNSWAVAHLAITNLIPCISMYVTTNAGWGDTIYGSLAEQVRTNFPSYRGTRTNGYVIFAPGVENDIIEINNHLNGGGIDWDITNVVVSMSNSCATIVSRGYKVLVVTIADTIGFDPFEESMRHYANQCMTNFPGISGFLDIDNFITTNTVPNQYDASLSEFSDDGHTNWVGRVNDKAVQVWP